MSFKGSGSWSTCHGEGLGKSWGSCRPPQVAPYSWYPLPCSSRRRAPLQPSAWLANANLVSSSLLAGPGFWEAAAASRQPCFSSLITFPGGLGVWTVGYSFHSGLAARQLRDQVPCWAEGPSPGTRPQGPGSPADPRWLQPNLRRYPLGLSAEPQTPRPPACP